MRRLIAEETLTDREGVDHMVGVTAPVFDDKRGDWSCEVTFEPRLRQVRIYGVSGLQALHLSLRLLETEYATLAVRGQFSRGDALIDPLLRYA